MTRFSIITPTYNRGALIAGAIASAASQSFPAYEHIVVDGASTDDSLQVLARYPQLSVISEPDHGLYDAINKGIKRASGDVIVLLNSDDTLLPGALAAAAAAFDAQPDIEILCGQVCMGNLFDHSADVLVGTPAMQRMRAGDLISGLTLTNARFIRRAVYERLGGFDLRYPIASDRDFLGRCLLADVRTAIINVPLYRYGAHPESLTFGSRQMNVKLLDEYLRLALDRLGEASTPRTRAFYRRWAMWAATYRLLSVGRSPQTEAALKRLVAHPAALFSLGHQALWHAFTKHERGGRPCALSNSG